MNRSGSVTKSTGGAGPTVPSQRTVCRGLTSPQDRVRAEPHPRKCDRGQGPSQRSPRSASLRVVLLTTAVLLSGLVIPVRSQSDGSSPTAAAAANLTTADRALIDEALPKQAVVPPRQPRRLLIYDANVGYPGHPSRFSANHAFQRMGETTGAFTAVVSRDPKVFAPESLQQFDAVFLNNTVGNLFEDPALRKSLADFVYRGGGLLGVHGTTVAFTRWEDAARDDWPEFGRMLGARGAAHRDSNEQVYITLDSPDHPLNQPFSREGFFYRDEFFRVHDPYSRKRLRVLFRIDTHAHRSGAGRRPTA